MDERNKINLLAWFVTVCVSLAMHPASALRMVLSSDVPEIMATHKACIRLELEQKDSCIFKDSLSVSIDASDIEVDAWTALSEPVVGYIASLKKNKRIFTESCDVEVVLAWDDAQVDAATFEQSCLCVSCVVQRSDDKHYPYTAVIPLGRHALPIVSDDGAARRSSEGAMTWLVGGTSAPMVHHDVLDEEFKILGKCGELWHEVEALCLRVSALPIFTAWYLLLVLLFFLLLVIRIGMFIVRKRSGQSLSEALECFGLLLIVGGLRLGDSVHIAQAAAYLCSCAVVMLGIAWYCFVRGHEASVWGKLKLTLGFLCLTSVLPLLTYAALYRFGIVR